MDAGIPTFKVLWSGSAVCAVQVEKYWTGTQRVTSLNPERAQFFAMLYFCNRSSDGFTRGCRSGNP